MGHHCLGNVACTLLGSGGHVDVNCCWLWQMPGPLLCFFCVVQALAANRIMTAYTAGASAIMCMFCLHSFTIRSHKSHTRTLVTVDIPHASMGGSMQLAMSCCHHFPSYV